MIVTNRDLETGRGTQLRAMYPEGKLECTDSEVAKSLPLENVYILSVEEFERLMAAVRNEEAYLPQLLARCVEADKEPASAKFYFEQHLTAQRIKRGRSRLVSEALDRSEARLSRALSQ